MKCFSGQNKRNRNRSTLLKHVRRTQHQLLQESRVPTLLLTENYQDFPEPSRRLTAVK